MRGETASYVGRRQAVQKKLNKPASQAQKRREGGREGGKGGEKLVESNGYYNLCVPARREHKHSLTSHPSLGASSPIWASEASLARTLITPCLISCEHRRPKLTLRMGVKSDLKLFMQPNPAVLSKTKI